MVIFPEYSLGRGCWSRASGQPWRLFPSSGMWERCRSCLQHPGGRSWLLPNMWWEMISPRGHMRTGWVCLQNTRKKISIWLPSYPISGTGAVWIWASLFEFILISWKFIGKYFDRRRTSGYTKIKLQGNTLHNFSFIFFAFHKQM